MSITSVLPIRDGILFADSIVPVLDPRNFAETVFADSVDIAIQESSNAMVVYWTNVEAEVSYRFSSLADRYAFVNAWLSMANAFYGKDGVDMSRIDCNVTGFMFSTSDSGSLSICN